MAYTWIADTEHTQLEFSVRHNQISKVQGQFLDFAVTATTPTADDFAHAQVRAQVQVRSVDTGHLDRDLHLQGADFFDVDTHPLAVFQAQDMQPVGEAEYALEGTLTLLGVTKPLHLQATFNGVVEDFDGDTRAGFTLSGVLNRFDFGLAFAQQTPDGLPVVGADVQLSIDIELVRQPA